jgi:hypothetical protein
MKGPFECEAVGVFSLLLNLYQGLTQHSGSNRKGLKCIRVVSKTSEKSQIHRGNPKEVRKGLKFVSKSLK